MSKILIITYYWPPDAGAGVPRVVKFAKYLKRHGYDPIIITSGKKSKIKDKSFISDTVGLRVLRTSNFIWESGNGNNSSKSSSSKSNYYSVIKSRIRNFIRINFLIPDSKIFWFNKAIKLSSQVIKKNKIDVIITTSPPYTVQLIGLKLKKKHKVNWISDFRDPWTEQVNYNIEYKNPLSTKINEYLERKVLNNSDLIITVGEKLKDLLAQKTETAIKVIHNGFDKEDFISVSESRISSRFVVGYYGSMSKYQIPKSLIEFINNSKNLYPSLYKDILFRVAGKISPEAKVYLDQNIDSNKLEILGYIDHKKFISEITKEQILLQLIPNQSGSEVIIGSKLYEYLNTDNPILFLGDLNSEGSKLTACLKGDGTYSYSDKEGISTFLLKHYDYWKNNKGLNSSTKNVEFFSRENLTKELINYLQKLKTDD